MKIDDLINKEAQNFKDDNENNLNFGATGSIGQNAIQVIKIHQKAFFR